MAPVIALIAGDELRERIARVVGRDVEVVFCGRAPELPERVAERGASAVILQLTDASGTDATPVLRLLHDRLPEIRLVVVHDLPAPDADELLRLGNLGVSACVYAGARDFAQSLRAALSRAAEQSPAAAILRRILPLVPAELRPFFIRCAEAASQPLSVVDAARGAGLAPRTLRARLRRAGLPPAQRIIRWNRILQACWRLDVSGRPVKAIVFLLGFESDIALRKQFARLTGLPIREVLARGGFRHLLNRFQGELTGEEASWEH